jgi:hypothetical protein
MKLLTILALQSRLQKYPPARSHSDTQQFLRVIPLGPHLIPYTVMKAYIDPSFTMRLLFAREMAYGARSGKLFLSPFLILVTHCHWQLSTCHLH